MNIASLASFLNRIMALYIFKTHVNKTRVVVLKRKKESKSAPFIVFVKKFVKNIV